MKTANKQLGIRVAKIPELRLAKALGPERRYALRWLWRLRALFRTLHYVLLYRPTPVRIYAPGERPLEEHKWRVQRGVRFHE